MKKHRTQLEEYIKKFMVDIHPGEVVDTSKRAIKISSSLFSREEAVSKYLELVN